MKKATVVKAVQAVKSNAKEGKMKKQKVVTTEVDALASVNALIEAAKVARFQVNLIGKPGEKQEAAVLDPKMQEMVEIQKEYMLSEKVTQWTEEFRKFVSVWRLIIKEIDEIDLALQVNKNQYRLEYTDLAAAVNLPAMEKALKNAKEVGLHKLPGGKDALVKLQNQMHQANVRISEGLREVNGVINSLTVKRQPAVEKRKKAFGTCAGLWRKLSAIANVKVTDCNDFFESLHKWEEYKASQVVTSTVAESAVVNTVVAPRVEVRLVTAKPGEAMITLGEMLKAKVK